ncbi:hypothetical protein BjapCC829_23065 [Bradyrhizobium barranii]|uniref:Helix-turn-helix protein n=1 Tax=Bradyrhizobium barranii TaxID=2992140 RepID=A0ABY3QC59_9BRAD|nr:hypothetical protein [Bradyrhizobium japonicum]UFW82872.1 hypothetical protein BjapCC829_23065 [Bradyrhizobium japonicum]
MIPAQPKIADTPAYWTHKIGDPTGPVAIGRMSQLVDFDPRLSETARLVYRFLINWYHHEHGDALLSQRHVATVMKKRAPDGAECPSRSAVSRAIILLLETGWVARTYRGRGRNKSASRYIPVFNVLDLAEQGRFPELAQQVGQFDDPQNRPTKRATTGPSGGPVHASTGPAGGPKTHIPDPGTDPRTGMYKVSASGPDAEAPAVAGIGFERIWRAYGRYGNKQASKQAFEAIASPDVDHIASRATAWAASAKSGQRRMPLEKWLAAEKYDEADRSVRPKAEAPKLDEEGEMGRRRSNAVDAAEAAEHDRKIRGAAIEISVPRGVPLTVVSSAVEKRDDDTWLAIQTDHGLVAILLEGRDAASQEAGQAHLGRLTTACGIRDIDDSSDLHGKVFMVVGDTFAAVTEDAVA